MKKSIISLVVFLLILSGCSKNNNFDVSGYIKEQNKSYKGNYSLDYKSDDDWNLVIFSNGKNYYIKEGDEAIANVDSVNYKLDSETNKFIEVNDTINSFDELSERHIGGFIDFIDEIEKFDSSIRSQNNNKNSYSVIYANVETEVGKFSSVTITVDKNTNSVDVLLKDSGYTQTYSLLFDSKINIDLNK